METFMDHFRAEGTFLVVCNTKAELIAKVEDFKANGHYTVGSMSIENFAKRKYIQAVKKVEGRK